MHAMEYSLFQMRRARSFAQAKLGARGIEYAGTSAVMAVSALARVGTGLTPFCAAAFAAGLVRGRNLPAMLVGCAAGSLAGGLSGNSLYPIVTCALALLFWLVWEALARKIPRLRAEPPTAAAMTAGLSLLLPGLAASIGHPAGWLVSLSCAVGAALLTLVYLTGSSVQASRAVWIGLSGACVLSVQAVGLNPLPVSALFCVLMASAGRGALAGAVLGGLCALCRGDANMLVVSCALGAAADIARMLHPGAVFRSLAAALAFVPLRICLRSAAPLTVLAGCALPAALPEKIGESVSRAFAPGARRDTSVATALRKRNERELRALSEAFEGLSQTCGADDPAFGEQQLLTRMRSALCGGCPEYAACWPGANSKAVKLFCQLMTAAIEQGGAPFENGEVPPDLLRLCRRGMTVPARLSALLNEFAVQRHRKVRMMEARRLLAAEFAQAARLLNAMAAEQTRPFASREGVAARAREALGEAGLPVRDVLAIRAERMEITVELRSAWTREQAIEAEKALSNHLDFPVTMETCDRQTAVFVPRISLRAVPAYSVLPAREEVSGDSCLIRPLDHSRVLVGLSDGMGSGEAAAEESQRVLRLLHALIRAGMSRETAISAVNGALLCRGGEELFATVDMLLIDLSNQRAEFTKLSACRSYIVRDGKALPVEGGRLPLGILDEIQPGFDARKIFAGDVIFMMTDGVADALPEPILEDLMTTAVSAAPEAMAQVLVNAAAARSIGRRDDMTVICVRIE